MREKWPMVRYVADKMKERLPHNVDVEELQASAAAGLLDAIRRFDPARGVKFESYAPHRMRGWILDDLRAKDWVPRLTRARSNRVEQALQKLERELGRIPTDQELAGELGISREEFEQLRREVDGAYLVPLKKRQLEKEPGRFTVDLQPDLSAETPLELASRADLWARLKHILPPKQVEILELYYSDDLTLKQIGRLLGLSESRVCQLHAKAIAILKERFK